jgi:hypothetical protein
MMLTRPAFSLSSISASEFCAVAATTLGQLMNFRVLIRPTISHCISLTVATHASGLVLATNLFGPMAKAPRQSQGIFVVSFCCFGMFEAFLFRLPKLLKHVQAVGEGRDDGQNAIRYIRMRHVCDDRGPLFASSLRKGHCQVPQRAETNSSKTAQLNKKEARRRTAAGIVTISQITLPRASSPHRTQRAARAIKAPSYRRPPRQASLKVKAGAGTQARRSVSILISAPASAGLEHKSMQVHQMAHAEVPQTAEFITARNILIGWKAASGS